VMRRQGWFFAKKTTVDVVSVSACGALSTWWGRACSCDPTPCFSVMRIDGTGAAETVVMLRTKLSLSRILPVLLPALAACCALVVTRPVVAGPPRFAGGAEPDYEASGFVVPAGYSQPMMGGPSGVMQADAPYGQTPMYPVAQTGFFHGAGSQPGCDAGMCNGGCDAPGGCCGCVGGGGSCLGDLRNFCLFCRGQGCGVCQSVGSGQLLGLIAALAPYTEAGIGAQRWYDFSAEAMFLSMDNQLSDFGVTSFGTGPNPNIVLRSSDAYNNDFDLGVRLSASMIFGVGGNLEVTYMGANDLGGSASVGALDPAGPTNYFSYISQFGTFPPGGFDDTDQSLFQGVTSRTRLHSGEFNYRRRWVGPYSRFQGSWLLGVRHIDLDDIFDYQTIGLNNDTALATDLRFFRSNYRVNNEMTGFQLGGDLWWNVTPGINLGLGLKTGVLGNVSRVRALIESNSIPAGGVVAASAFDDRARSAETSWMTELDATLIYRFSYSWSFKSSYYLLGIDNVGLGASSLQTTTFNDAGTGITTPTLGAHRANDDVVFQGFSFGLEYLW
jgi:hypothetical protein